MDHLCLNIKLADFGSCIDLNSMESGGPSRLAGTLAFMAPEVMGNDD
jgi:serine/threonine protein kinase